MPGLQAGWLTGLMAGRPPYRLVPVCCSAVCFGFLRVLCSSLLFIKYLPEGGPTPENPKPLHSCDLSPIGTRSTATLGNGRVASRWPPLAQPCPPEALPRTTHPFRALKRQKAGGHQTPPHWSVGAPTVVRPNSCRTYGLKRPPSPSMRIRVSTWAPGLFLSPRDSVCRILTGKMRAAP